MELISIKGTPKTPTVNFNHQTGEIEIKGRSIPENSTEFYTPLYEWLTQYQESPNKKTVVNIQMEYFNTSSSKCILDVFKKLEVLAGAGNDVHINWFYEKDDEDMQEAGEDYKFIISVPFSLIEVEA